MATLYISEYRQLASVPSATNFAPQAGQGGQEPSLVDQTVNIAASSTASNPFGGYTSLVRIHCDAICSIVFSTPAQMATNTIPTAAATNKRLAANQTEYFGVLPMQRVAVIVNT